MDAPLYVTSPSVRLPEGAAPPAALPGGGGEAADLLRQLLHLQREQLHLTKVQQTQMVEQFTILRVQQAQLIELGREQLNVLRAQQAAQDGLARWKAFLARWQGEFGSVGMACKLTLPVVERAYLELIQELTDKLNDEDGLAGEFALAEFLDRYGVRLGQLGTVLSQLGPLADAAPPL